MTFAMSEPFASGLQSGLFISLVLLCALPKNKGRIVKEIGEMTFDITLLSNPYSIF